MTEEQNEIKHPFPRKMDVDEELLQFFQRCAQLGISSFHELVQVIDDEEIHQHLRQVSHVRPLQGEVESVDALTRELRQQAVSVLSRKTTKTSVS